MLTVTGCDILTTGADHATARHRHTNRRSITGRQSAAGIGLVLDLQTKAQTRKHAVAKDPSQQNAKTKKRAEPNDLQQDTYAQEPQPETPRKRRRDEAESAQER